MEKKQKPTLHCPPHQIWKNSSPFHITTRHYNLQEEKKIAYFMSITYSPRKCSISIDNMTCTRTTCTLIAHHGTYVHCGTHRDHYPRGKGPFLHQSEIIHNCNGNVTPYMQRKGSLNFKFTYFHFIFSLQHSLTMIFLFDCCLCPQ